MAERCNFTAYCLFSLLNTIVYCIPAGWLWGDHGFLHQMGAIDIAGSGGVHLVGGTSAFVAAAMLGPRMGRYEDGGHYQMGNPVNAILGLFMLWWGWLSFNCGSTFGITQHRWKYAARAGAATLTSSFGGGLVGMAYSFISQRGIWDVGILVNSVLSSLVGVTAGCSLYHLWEGLIAGALSALATCFTMPLMDRFHIDDPVGAVAVHAVGGLCGMLAVGFFTNHEDLLSDITLGNSGAFKGGGFYILGVQLLSCTALAAWAAASTFILLYVINKIISIRMSVDEEIRGADFVEHGIKQMAIFKHHMIKQFKVGNTMNDRKLNKRRNKRVPYIFPANID